MLDFFKYLNRDLFYYCWLYLKSPLEKIYLQGRSFYFGLLGMNTTKIGDSYLIPVEYEGQRYTVYLRKPSEFKRRASFISKEYKGPFLDFFYQDYSDIETELKNMKNLLH